MLAAALQSPLLLEFAKGLPMVSGYKDPEGRQWTIKRRDGGNPRKYTIDLECADDPSLNQGGVVLPYSSRLESAAAIWYRTAPGTDEDRLSRIARASTAHIHSWFYDLKDDLWNGAPPTFINNPGTDGITPLMHAVVDGDLQTALGLIDIWKANPKAPSKLPNLGRFLPHIPPNPYEVALLWDRPDLLAPMVRSRHLSVEELQNLKTRYTPRNAAPFVQSLLQEVQKELRRRIRR